MKVEKGSIDIQAGIKKNTYKSFILKELSKNRYLYMMLAPILLYFIIFHYLPMYGLLLAFQDYFPSARSAGNFIKMFISGEWIGFDNFKQFFGSPYFFRTLKNIIMINVFGILFVFSAPIILALLLNELRYRQLLIFRISYPW